MEINFQNIFDILQESLPEKWEKVVFYAEYTKGSYSMKYYVNSGDGMYVDCYDISKISKAQLLKKFMQIDKIFAFERNRLKDKEKWSAVTIILNRDGSFKSEFDYADIEGKTLEYHQKWKDKYLVIE